MSDKWWDMPDDELDDLFREASDKVEIPFDSSAFDKLRHKIDNQPEVIAPKSVKKRWLLPLALLLLVGVGMVYYFVSKKSENASPNLSTSINSKNNQVNNLSSEFSKNNIGNGKNQALTTIKSKAENTKKIFEASKATNPLSLNKAISKTTNSLKTTANTPQNSTLEMTKTKIREDKIKVEIQNGHLSSKDIEDKAIEKVITSTESSTTEKALKEEILSANNLIHDTEFSSKTIKHSPETHEVKSIVGNNRKSKSKKSSFNKAHLSKQTTSNENISFEKNDIAPKTEEVINRTNFFNVNDLASKKTKSLLADLAIDLPPFIDSLPRTKPILKMSRFGIRLALSPDINSIEKLETSVLSSSLGLLFEYRLNKRFVLQTGITYSNKKYGGEFDYYHSWADTWQKYHPSKPVEVDGGCKVIDIPLNLRFNAFQQTRQTWFVSAGISSYLMLNESYTYNYAWGVPKTVDWQDKTSYYWSTLNLSIGIEKQLTKHITIQAEPYLKTPLAGVGRGSVNLYSSGILFSTKYNF